MSWFSDEIGKITNTVKNHPAQALESIGTGGLSDALNQVGDKISQNKTLQDVAHKLGFGKSDAQKAADQELAAAKAKYDALNPPTLTPMEAVLASATGASAMDQAPTAYNDISVDPAYKEAQLEQLGALRNLAARGGHDAASDANLAQIQQAENANARGQRDAILQAAAARGMGGSGAALLAQLNASQNATNNQSMQDMDVLGQRQNTALQAGANAANIAANMQNTDYAQAANRAAAQDAINRFNAGQQTGINQFNAGQQTGINQYNAGIQNQAQQYNTGLQQTAYQNQFQKAAGQAGANMSGLNYNQAQASLGAQQMGNILGAAVKGATAVADSGGKAAHGGQIPGIAAVPGDSSLNDIVPIMSSPGEVVVPRSLAKAGTSSQISHFVKHPPQVKIPGTPTDHEAMLSALKNIRRRRG